MYNLRWGQLKIGGDLFFLFPFLSLSYFQENLDIFFHELAKGL